MAQKPVYINTDDFLNEGREKINEFAIDPAYRAELKSEQAVDDANRLGNEAKETANQADNQSLEAIEIAKDTNNNMNNIIGGETDSAEIIAARKPVDGEPYTTVGERINSEIGKLSVFRREDTSVVEKMTNEFYARAINFDWVYGESDEEILGKSLKKALAEQRDLFLPKRKYFLDQVAIEMHSELEITVDFNGSILVGSEDNYNDFMLSIQASNVTFKNFKIDGRFLKSKGVDIYNSSNLNFTNFKICNLGVPVGKEGATYALQVQAKSCRDIHFSNSEIKDLKGNDNGVIGDWSGACKGLLIIGDGESDVGFNNITVDKLKIHNLISEDADGIHFQKCGFINTVLANLVLSDCDSRMIKIQGSSGVKFKDFECYYSPGRRGRRSVVSDYSCGNEYLNFRMLNINSVHAFEFIVSKETKIPTSVKNFHIELIGPSTISGEITAPFTFGNNGSVDNILQNTDISDGFISATARGLTFSVHTKNLAIKNITIEGVDDSGGDITGVGLSAKYSTSSRQMASHVNCILENITSPDLPVYWSADTTFAQSVSKDNNALNGKDSLIPMTNNDNNDIQTPPRIYHRSAKPVGTSMHYNQNDFVLLTRPLEGHAILGWICVEAGSPGVWKDIKY